MFFIIKKEEVSEDLGDFLAEKCWRKRGGNFIFQAENWGENWGVISSNIGQDIYEFFYSQFVYTATAVDYLVKNYNDPIQAAAQFCEETGLDSSSLNASTVASHFFCNEILSEFYNLDPVEEDFLYIKQDVKLINHKKGAVYATI